MFIFMMIVGGVLIYLKWGIEVGERVEVEDWSWESINCFGIICVD